RRARSAPWTPADVALLDEAAELLGEEEAQADEAELAAAAERSQEVEYAGRVLDMVADIAPDAIQMTTAADLAERYGATASRRALIDEAASDRSWAFGHVVVDEAQELSPMQWRVLMRRCPSRSMTVVGDTAQTGSAAGARSWGQMLSRYVGDRWRQAELTINYRTPGLIMQVATDTLAASGITASTITSARMGDWPPTAELVAGSLTAAAAALASSELARIGAGRLAVIGPADQLPDQLPADERLSLLTPSQAKGLEFDVVILLEPAAILAQSRRGASDLYVAMTRSTQRLQILHRQQLPAGLTELATAR
ncbi:MAG: AAA family ATPase, partial [Actinomycetota bacterium]|nr:AAA family ATPase [Actinomycetota bacterium]